MIFVALLVVGIVAYTQIPFALLPSGNESPWLHVFIPYPDAHPREIEQQIARPLEAVLRTLCGVEAVYTHSGPGRNGGASGCIAEIRFSQNVDMAEAYNQLRERVDRLLIELPDDVEDVFIRKWSTDDIMVLGVDFLLDREYPDLHALVDEHIRQPLECVDGVANVEIWGVQPMRVEIGLIRDRLNAHRVDVHALVSQLRNDNFALSTGWVRDGSRKVFVRSDSRFASLNDIRNTPINGRPDLVLGDVADITYAPPEDPHYFRLDGQPGVGIVVRKEGNANTVDVSRRAVDVLMNDLLQRPQLRGFQPRVYINQGEIILNSLRQLQSAGLWGGVFAVLVLFFFMRRGRMTLIITAAIPLSVLISLTVTYFMGWSLNVVTMMGLIIGLGMVIDNSIVVTEAIYARRIAGEPPTRAALHGASEVALAITMSTATTCAVFLPLIFMSGDRQLSFMMARIGMPVIFALVGSLLVALLFIPLVASHILSTKPPAEPPTIAWLTNTYTRLLNTVIKYRFETAMIAIAILVSATFPFGRIAKTFSGDGNIINSMFVRFDMPIYYSAAQTDSIMLQYEAFLDEHREKYGIIYVQSDIWKAGGSCWAFMKSDERAWYTVAWQGLFGKLGFDIDTPMTSAEATEHFRAHAPRFAGVRMNVDRRETAEGNTTVTLFGDDTSTLLVLAEEVERRLRLVPEISAVRSDMERGDDELCIWIDRDASQRCDIDGRTVASTLNSAMRGATLTPYHTREREVGLRLALRKDDRRTLDQIMSLPIENPNGVPTSLRTLVDVSVNKTIERVSRENGKTRVTVTAFSSEKDLQKLAGIIRDALDGFEMPTGYQWTLTGRFESMQTQNTDMAFAALMAIAFVFLLMGVLFESFVLPLSVILAIPFSFVGVYWLLYLVDQPFDMMAGIGAIILVGVVVNNAIVLVDLINRLRMEGHSRVTAIVEGGRNRFRPIIMTSATTIFGLVPMAVGNTNALGIPYNTLGIAMIGGLLLSTTLTLFVVPLFYALLDDLSIVVRRMVALVRLAPSRTYA